MDIVERLRRWSPEDSSYDWFDEAVNEIERLRQLVHELNSVAYVIDSHGVVHQSFTIVYKELE
jgi:hypothetical protein